MAGSFFVFRKLEQNVKAFKTAEQKLADEPKLTGKARERAGAFVVGRFEDGTPVTMSPNPKDAKEPRTDFDYSGDAAGGRCPFHAHIRKTNPRGSGGFGQTEDQKRRHIMVRRGITYEDTLRVIHPDALPEANTTQEFLDNVQRHLPETGVGLLFMAYNARLDDQFGFTRKSWANSATFPQSPKPVGIDGVIGQGANVADTHAFPNEWDNPAAGTTVHDFKTFVNMLGGEYFFASSVKFLRNI